MTTLAQTLTPEDQRMLLDIAMSVPGRLLTNAEIDRLLAITTEADYQPSTARLDTILKEAA